MKGFKEGRALSDATVKKLKAARTLRLQAEDCEKQARAIEDELVSDWSEDEGQQPGDEPPEDIPEDTDELKAFREQLKLLIGGNLS